MQYVLTARDVLVGPEQGCWTPWITWSSNLVGGKFLVLKGLSRGDSPTVPLIAARFLEMRWEKLHMFSRAIGAAAWILLIAVSATAQDKATDKIKIGLITTL